MYLEAYFDSKDNIDQIFDFWFSKVSLKNDKELAELALDVLAVPVTSAGIEHVFSIASIVQGSRRYSLGAESSENELFVRINSQYI